MNLTTYEQRMAALGINRFALSAGFDSDMPNSAISKESEYVNEEASMKVKPPPLTEDLSRLNPGKHAKGKISGANGGRVCHENRRAK